MASRPKKESPIQTITYEIDMLRHCAAEHASKSKRSKEQEYLLIEGFLLHFRNLISFLRAAQGEATDLSLADPKGWSATALDPQTYSDLQKRARELDDDHPLGRQNNASLMSLISRYLAHVTEYRHLNDIDWPVEDLFKEIDPILGEFENRFVKTIAVVKERVVGAASGSTASIRITEFFDKSSSLKRLT